MHSVTMVMVDMCIIGIRSTIRLLCLKFIVAMAMGDTCVQSIMAIRMLEIVPEAVAMAMVVMGGMCVQSIYHGHTKLETVFYV